MAGRGNYNPSDWANKRKAAMEKAAALRAKRQEDLDPEHTFKPQINKESSGKKPPDIKPYGYEQYQQPPPDALDELNATTGIRGSASAVDDIPIRPAAGGINIYEQAAAGNASMPSGMMSPDALTKEVTKRNDVPVSRERESFPSSNDGGMGPPPGRPRPGGGGQSELVSHSSFNDGPPSSRGSVGSAAGPGRGRGRRVSSLRKPEWNSDFPAGDDHSQASSTNWNHKHTRPLNDDFSAGGGSAARMGGGGDWLENPKDMPAEGPTLGQGTMNMGATARAAPAGNLSLLKTKLRSRGATGNKGRRAGGGASAGEKRPPRQRKPEWNVDFAAGGDDEQAGAAAAPPARDPFGIPPPSGSNVMEAPLPGGRGGAGMYAAASDPFGGGGGGAGGGYSGGGGRRAEEEERAMRAGDAGGAAAGGAPPPRRTVVGGRGRRQPQANRSPAPPRAAMGAPPTPPPRSAGAPLAALDSGRGGSAGGALAFAAPDGSAVDTTLYECGVGCGRKFNEKALAKHEKVCRKVFVEKRRAFDTQQQRITGEEHAKALAKTKQEEAARKREEARGRRAKARGVRANPEDQPVGNGKASKWKAQSDQLREAMKQQRLIARYEKEGKSLADLPQMAPSAPDPSLVPCPTCGRRFNQQAADRHIPKCATIRNKPKTLQRGARVGLGAAARKKDPAAAAAERRLNGFKGKRK